MIDKATTDRASPDPAAVRADEQALRQWAVDRAIPLARPHDPASITVIAQLLVDFVQGVRTLAAD